jgi:hypothetical protein
MVRQRSQSAWVSAFLGAADWARREAGRAARSSAEADERESRIAGLSKVVSMVALAYAPACKAVGSQTGPAEIEPPNLPGSLGCSISSSPLFGQ